MDVWWDIPNVIAWDRIVLEHHSMLGNGALMEDAAEAILTTELQLYNGIYRQIILTNFVERGFVDITNYYPSIVHDPLPDTENTQQVGFEVVAEITSSFPLDELSLQLFWRADQDPYASVLLTPTGSADEFSAIIPGPFNQQIISYFLTASDTLGMASFLPSGAPTEAFQFYVGPDPYPPVVVWTDSLGATVFPSLSIPVAAVATDNIGIESMELFWCMLGSDWQSSPMIPAEADTFIGTLSYLDQLPNQIVEYFVRATDSSTQHHSTDGLSQFFTLDESADLEDFEGELADWIFNGDWGLTNQFSHSSDWAIEDSPGVQYPANSDTWAQWGQTWDLSELNTASLFFWEMHMLMPLEDWGYLELSVDNGPWMSHLQITGSDNTWHHREIVLDEYCGQPAHDINFRFRTVTDEASSLFGWFIDDLSITVGSIVAEQPMNTDSPYPESFSLSSIYPNPFNPETTITFELPSTENITMQIFNTHGQLVEVIADGTHPPGIHQVTFNGKSLASGLYFCRMNAGNYTQTRKLLLLK